MKTLSLNRGSVATSLPQTNSKYPQIKHEKISMLLHDRSESYVELIAIQDDAPTPSFSMTYLGRASVEDHFVGSRAPPAVEHCLPIVEARPCSTIIIWQQPASSSILVLDKQHLPLPPASFGLCLPTNPRVGSPILRLSYEVFR